MNRDDGEPNAAAAFAAHVDPELMTALTSLADSTRDLVEAVVLSDTDAATLAAATAEIRALAARLGARRRSGPIRLVMDAPRGQMRQPHSPVTGEANPIAPPIRMEMTREGTARSEFTLGHIYEGPPGAVHGGVCAAILDHLLGAAAAAGERPGMTATLTLRYRRPTPIGAALVAEAWISAVDGRITTVQGRIRDHHGATTVEATGEFMLPRRWASALGAGDAANGDPR